MKLKQTFIAVLGGVALATIAAAPASAKIVTVTYSGTVGSGFDLTGIFGTANANLAGKAFVSKYVFDTATGRFSSGPNFNAITGAQTATSAQITIGDVTFVFSVPTFGQLFSGYDKSSILTHTAADAGSSSGDDEMSRDAHVTLVNSVSTRVPDVLPRSVTGNFAGTGLTGSGFFEAYDYILTYSTEDVTYTKNTYAALNTNTVSIVGGVPEPATWAMMILGFGVVGGAMRSAKRRSDAKFDAKIKRITMGDPACAGQGVSA